MNLRGISNMLFVLAVLGVVGLVVVAAQAARSENAILEEQQALDRLEERIDAFSARSDALLFDPMNEEDLATYVAEARRLQAEMQNWSDLVDVGPTAVRTLDEMIALAQEHADRSPEAAPEAGPDGARSPAEVRALRMAELGLALDATSVDLARAFRADRIAAHRESLIVLAAVLSAFALLTLTIAALLRWRVSGPLTELVRTAQRVSFGDERIRARDARLPELTQLSAALDAAIDRERVAQAQLAETNRELRRHASRLADAQAMANLGHFHATSFDGVIDVSAELLRIAGLEAESIVPTFETLAQLVEPDGRPVLRDAYSAAWAGKPIDPFVYRVQRPTGEIRTVEIRARPTFDADGRVEAVEGTVLDITEFVALERDLEDERRLARIGNRLARLGAWSVEAGTLSPTWSDMVSEIYETPKGYVPPLDEGIAFYAPHHRPAIRAAFERLVLVGEPYDIEAELDTANGRRIWVRTVGQPARDASGAIVGYEGVIQDIDARKRGEEALEEERRMSAMADRVARVGGWSIDFPSFEHHWSDMVSEIHGLPAGRVLAPEEGLSMYAPASRPLIQQAFDRLVEDGVPYDLELQLDRADGRRIWVRTVAQPVFDDEGRLTSVEGAFLDIDARKRSEETLDEERRMNAIASRVARVGGWSVDLETNVVSWSDEVFDLFELPNGFSPTLEAVFSSFDADDRKKMEAGFQRAARDGEAYDVESQLITASGERLWIRTVGVPRFDDHGNVVSVEGAVQDVDARKRSEEALRKALAVQEQLMSTLPAQVALLAADGTILEVNERWRQFGRENGAKDPTFGVGSNYVDVSRSARGRDAGVAGTIAEGLSDLLDGQRDVLSVEYPCHAPDRHRWFQLEARALATDGERRAVLMHVDVTERHEAEARLEYLAFHDPLTGLLNRVGLSNELSTRLDTAWLEGHVLVEIDLQDMSSVNDVHGFEAGDALLNSIATRLSKPTTVRPPDLLARTGGDEFVFLIGPNEQGEEQPDRPGERAVRAARDLIDEAVGASHPVAANESVKIDVHTGLTRLGANPRRAEDLLREAQLALFEGRSVASTGWSEYSVDYEEEVRERRQLANELQLAIERGELRLHFHPTVDTRTGTLASAEALVRWLHPERGLLPPGAFVPAAERSGLIVPLGQWVLDEACRKMARWRDSLQLTRIAVNASAEELIQTSYAADVLEALERHDVDPTMLTIEVTETALVRDAALVAKHLRQLRDAGVRVALDDFGTGYASLAILKTFPFQHVKIDRLFVSDMLTDAYSHGVIESVLALANTVGATVIGEGVETEEQLRALVELGCEIAQGYYFCLPLAEEDFEWLLRTRSTLPVADSG